MPEGRLNKLNLQRSFLPVYPCEACLRVCNFVLRAGVWMSEGVNVSESSSSFFSSFPSLSLFPLSLAGLHWSLFIVILCTPTYHECFIDICVECFLYDNLEEHVSVKWQNTFAKHVNVFPSGKLRWILFWKFHVAIPYSIDAAQAKSNWFSKWFATGKVPCHHLSAWYISLICTCVTRPGYWLQKCDWKC